MDMTEKMKEVREEILNLLMVTKRPGMDKLCEKLDKIGFFTAPCSGSYHLAKEGGLAEHSLNVYKIMRADAALKMPYSYRNKNHDSIIICSLLHDVGKCGDYGKPNYVPNMIKDGRPTKADPVQKYKQSESKPYETNKDLSPIDHEIRSVKIVSKYIDLTEDEELAILWHNGLYGNFKYQIQSHETPLYLLLHSADMWASRVTEVENQPE